VHIKKLLCLRHFKIICGYTRQSETHGIWTGISHSNVLRIFEFIRSLFRIAKRFKRLIWFCSWRIFRACAGSRYVCHPPVGNTPSLDSIRVGSISNLDNSPKLACWAFSRVYVLASGHSFQENVARKVKVTELLVESPSGTSLTFCCALNDPANKEREKTERREYASVVWKMKGSVSLFPQMTWAWWSRYSILAIFTILDVIP